ncbi:MAG: purine-nucleoside phosphorylase [Clostridia bacterium]|nr:purine-nucleoside phosphorylase [Clostridia bacterium]
MLEKCGYKEYAESAEYIKELIGSAPDTAIILGSGLDRIVGKMTEKVVIPYRDIPNFPVSTVSYQKGELVSGVLDGKKILAMNGRFHYYEGWEMWQTAYPIAVMKLLGIEKIIITNAAGGIGDNVDPGDLVLITDHIKFMADSPLRGANLDEFGVRFPDMQSVYDRDMINTAEAIAREHGISVTRGVYAYMAGPQYETPAEIRALKTMGADVVGMSTVAEVIVAAYCGIKVLCISCVSNKAAGITGNPLTEEEVLETAASIAAGFETLVTEAVKRI